MVEPSNEAPEEFAPTREHEFQDSHYHDEEPDIVNDELASRVDRPVDSKKPKRRPPPKPRYYED